MKKKATKENNEEKQHVKHDPIIKLGSETETEDGIYYLLRSKIGYEVWKQPFEQWQGKKIRSYRNWHKVKSSKKIGECRAAIKEAISQPNKTVAHKSAAQGAASKIKRRKK